MDARERILAAFRELVLSVPFEEFKTHDVIRRAGVARSTFYAHFKDKNDLLLASLGPILTVLAAACRGGAQPGELTATLEHVWDNRMVARILFRPPVAGRIARELVRLLQAAEVETTRSHLLGNGLLGVLEAWTTGRIRLTPGELSERLLQLDAGLGLDTPGRGASAEGRYR